MSQPTQAEQQNLEYLVDAVERVDEKAARTLVADLPSKDVSLLLHRFAARRNPAAVKLLLRLGADPAVIDEKDGTTALHHAAALNDRESAEALVDAGSPLDVRDAEHASSPVMWARNFGHEEMISYLLVSGARLNLPEAAKLGLVNVVAGFLDDVPGVIDIRQGWSTPLVAAAANGHVSTVRLLLERGADPNATSGDGGTALRATRFDGNESSRAAVIELLRQYGARDQGSD